MHKEILTEEQVELLPLVKSFSKDFGLVGGTAIALYLGHRRSIDFDLFTKKEFENLTVRQNIRQFGKKIEAVFRDEAGQYAITINGVRFAFFHYPFKVSFSKKFNGLTRLPNLLTLAAMKAHALGRRAKWKDYVDLYFVMERYHSPSKVIAKAKQIFRSEFNEKMFRVQLAYFKDIDYSEKIIYMKGFEKRAGEIKKKLIEFSLK